MFPIPGILISIITFPGVIVHELAHQLFCRWYRVAIFEVCYFRFENPVGYVIHEHPSKKWQQIMIATGPFFINTVIGALIALPGAIPVLKFSEGGFINYFFIYLGISIAMHAFPSTGDASSMWESVMQSESPWYLKALTVPIVGIIYLGAFGSFFWLDVLYGVGVALGLPSLIVYLLM